MNLVLAKAVKIVAIQVARSMGGYYGLDRSNSNAVDGHHLRRYLDKALITPGGR